jgi:endonuclease/exonuclease/phosphatase family metal-dependent hydrolase
VLDEASLRTTKKPSNYLFLGDLNTMGLSLTCSQGDIGAEDEIERLAKKAQRRGMRLLEKNHPATYWPGSKSSLPRGDLDHVVLSDHLKIQGDRAIVRGWVECGSDGRKDGWRRKYSDHGMIWVGVG